MTRKKRKLARRLLWAAAVLLVLIVAAAMVGKWYLAPAMLRSRLTSALEDYWDGPATVAEVDFNYFGPTHLRRVVLRDTAGRAWATARSVKLTLRDWPGTSPALRDVRIDRLALQCHFVHGKLALPVREWPRLFADFPPYIDVRRFHVRGLSLTGLADGARTFALRDLELLVTRDGQEYDLSLKRPAPGPSNVPLVSGRVDPRTQQASFKFQGTGFAGRLRAWAPSDASPRGPIDCQGQLNLLKADVADLSRLLGRPGLVTGGRITLDYKFAKDRTGPDAFTGKGSVLIDNANADRLPVVRAIFASLNLAPDDSASDFDADVRFRSRRSLLTIDAGRFANPLLAVEIEPGGTVDLKTGRIDLYAVAAILSDLQTVLTSLPIPFVNLVASVTKKLARLHVVGRWDDRDAIRVTKEPLKDITEGTIDFISGVAGSGGQLGEGLFKSIEGLIGQPKEKPPKK